jgi:hypothetical protein
MIALITQGRKIEFTTFQPPTKHKSEPKAHAILPTGYYCIKKINTKQRYSIKAINKEFFV